LDFCTDVSLLAAFTPRKAPTGPASLTVIDPDENPILIDQDVDRRCDLKRPFNPMIPP
jgi:hypothetical protein